MARDTYRGGTRRRQAAAVLAAFMTVMVVLAVGGALLTLRPAEYTGRATLMVVPRDVSSSADFYETLSQGKLISTYAELLRNALGATSAGAGSEITTDFQVVPDTALIRISATGPVQASVESVTVDLSRRAAVVINDLGQPFAVTRIAEPRVSPATGHDLATYAAAIGAIALVAGLTVGRVVLRGASERGSSPSPWPAPQRLAAGRRSRPQAKASLPVSR